MKIKLLKPIPFISDTKNWVPGDILEIRYWKDHPKNTSSHDTSNRLIICPINEHGCFISKHNYRKLLLGEYIEILDSKKEFGQ